MTWKSRGQPILDIEWMNIEDVHVNYPILNDRIAYSRGTVKHLSKLIVLISANIALTEKDEKTWNHDAGFNSCIVL